MTSRSSFLLRKPNGANDPPPPVSPNTWTKLVDGQSLAVDVEKDPPPKLLNCPPDLTPNKKRRRDIVAHILEVENTFVDSLDILLRQYKDPLLSQKSLLSTDKVEQMFYMLDELLDCHLAFRIELSSRAQEWDEKEMIGGAFVEFCKDSVLEKYSKFVENFGVATELFNKAMKKKSFSVFIMSQQEETNVNLGLHGLLLKIVHRFPRYNLQFKDLVEDTPVGHPDYELLHMALSKLESVTYQLNTKVKVKEQQLAASTLQKQLFGTKLKKQTSDILLRQDDVTEVNHMDVRDSRSQEAVRLYLFDDQLVISSTSSRSSKRIKWSCLLEKMEYHENVQPRNASSATATLSEGVFADDELVKLKDDEQALAQILEFISGFHKKYQGFDVEVIKKQLKDLQVSIDIKRAEQQVIGVQYIALSYVSRGRRGMSMFDFGNPERAKDWTLDFRAAKLAQNAINHASKCWISDEPKLTFPLVVDNVIVDSQQGGGSLQAKCATPIFLTNKSGEVRLQFLWLCSNNEKGGHVTLLAAHSNKPYITDSSPVCDGPITSCVLVPSNIHCWLDHVWMSDSTNHVHVHQLNVNGWKNPRRKFSVPAAVKDMCYYGNHVYLALADGSVAKCAGSNTADRTLHITKLAEDAETPVNVLLPGEKESIVAACGKTLYTLKAANKLSVVDHKPIDKLSGNIEKMIRVSQGIWLSCQGTSQLHLLHHETYMNILQIHIGTALHRLAPQEVPDNNQVAITALSASQGLVWVGSNTGHILTIPVPIMKGIPQPSGKIDLSSVSHTGPVMFISTIDCGITFQPLADVDGEVLGNTTMLEQTCANWEYDDNFEVVVEPTVNEEEKSGDQVKVTKEQATAAFKPDINDDLELLPGINDTLLGKSFHTALNSPLQVDNLVAPNSMSVRRKLTKISFENNQVTATEFGDLPFLENSTLLPNTLSERDLLFTTLLKSTATRSTLLKVVNPMKTSAHSKAALSQVVEQTSTSSSTQAIAESTENSKAKKVEFEETSMAKKSATASEEKEERHEDLIVKSLLKTSLVISGGGGFINHHQPDSKTDKPSVIMWQQKRVG